ncbi:helix-turn-helix transcriptional regulator [Fulvimarina manganoxydans]|nr:helix-turn-helix transcriptional regulator [Fulvimarina manganoxydans]
MDFQTTKDELIHLVYDCVLGNHSWQFFLDQLSKCLNDGKATLFFHDERAGSGAFTITSGIEEKYLQQYSEYYSAVNPWMPGAATRQLGLAVSADYMLAKDALRKTEYYADFLQPQEIRSAIGVTIWREESRNLLLSVTTGDENESQIAEGMLILQALVPHLAKAFSLYRKKKQHGGLQLSQVPSELGFISIHENRTVKQMNHFAKKLLTLGDGIWIDAMGKFCSSEASLVECIVHQMSPRQIKQHQTNPMFVVRRRLNQFPLRIHIAPSPITSELGFFAGPECKMVIEDLSAPPLLDLNTMRKFYSLTEAEARIVRDFVHGGTVADVARRAHITQNTARVHLKNIYAKMGVSRQASMVQLARAFEVNPYTQLL